MLHYAKGSETTDLSHEDLKQGLYEGLSKLGTMKKVLAIPPDYTRFHSRAGELTESACEFYGDKMTDVLPALGTHSPMKPSDISHMFGKTPAHLFREHDWRNDIISLGDVPAEYINQVSEGRVNYSWPAQVNKLLISGGFDLILSIGQVVPHEVIGMANHNKNIFVGTGGAEGINKSHFLGAAYGMERIMGRADTPVRKVLDYASDHFGGQMPIVFVLTVLGKDENGVLKTRGLFIGDDRECFDKAAELSLKVNFIKLQKGLKKVVVYLDPSEFKSTWLGNKSIYRTRMAIEDGGELIVLAPGLKEFGEDREIDRLIRKYGYLNTPEILDLTDRNEELKNNLSAAAHLIHGSTEGRFRVTYCPGNLSREEINSVNYNFGILNDMRKIYNTDILKDGFNILGGGEEIFYISNPALGLWANEERFKNS
jgi:nickel-dependent lactate racemase